MSEPYWSVICDQEKLIEQGCLGAPDWIIEILSPGKSKREMQTKYALYQESSVTEYRMVYPYKKAVLQFVLDDITEKYQLIAMFSAEDYATPRVFPDLKIELQEVFEE